VALYIIIILAIVQGLTEFLPVSSSGHLVVMTQLLGEEPSVFFTVVLHLGTLCAVLWVYRKEILDLLKGMMQKDKKSWTYAGYIIAATSVTAVIGIAGKSLFEETYSMIPVIIGGWVFTGILLWLTDRISDDRISEKNNELTLRKALIIGLFQAIAILPGVSRSGFTIIGALFMGIERKMAAQFAFLISIPAIAGAAFLEFKDIDKTVMNGGTLMLYLIGFLIAAIVGYLSIRLFVATVLKGRLRWFSWYLFLLAFATLLYYIL